MKGRKGPNFGFAVFATATITIKRIKARIERIDILLIKITGALNLIEGRVMVKMVCLKESEPNKHKGGMRDKNSCFINIFWLGVIAEK